jgi:hypothetical protein
MHSILYHQNKENNLFQLLSLKINLNILQHNFRIHLHKTLLLYVLVCPRILLNHNITNINQGQVYNYILRIYNLNNHHQQIKKCTLPHTHHKNLIHYQFCILPHMNYNLQNLHNVLYNHQKMHLILFLQNNKNSH